MSNIHDYVPGEKPGRTITWVESQEEVVSAPPINPPMNWGGHPLVRTTKHGDPNHHTPERSVSPVGGAAAGAAPEPDSGDDRMVTNKSGSASPVQLGQPCTQNECMELSQSQSGIPEKSEEPGPARKRKKGAFQDSGEGGLYATEKALIEQIIASAGPVLGWDESEDKIDYTTFPRRELARYAVLETEKTKNWKTRCVQLQEELGAAQERIRQLEEQIQADPQPVSPAAGGVQERIRQLEEQIQAGPQPVSTAAGGAGYSPVSPAGGAGCQPVSSDGQNWMMRPFPLCQCTDKPKRPYVPRRIRKEGPTKGMVMGACANWEYKGYPGCGWYNKPFTWPPHLDPK